MVNNPWDVNRITWGDPFADGDKEALAKMGYFLCQSKQKFDSLMRSKDLRMLVESCKLDHMYHECCLVKFKELAKSSKKNDKTIELDYYTLPEPFSGNVESPVYCLNMNPGEADPLYKNDPYFLYLTRLSLKHLLRSSMWSEDFLGVYEMYEKYENGKMVKRSHLGCKWYSEKTKDLRLALGEETLHLFMIEYFPYHSKGGFEFPSWLPSYEYTNCLIEEAIDKGKFIVIMRQKDRWFQRVPRLKNYKSLAYLECGQGAFLSQNNVIYKTNAFNDLVAALKQ